MTALLLGLVIGGAAGFRGGLAWGVRRAVGALAREDVRKRQRIISGGGKG